MKFVAPLILYVMIAIGVFVGSTTKGAPIGLAFEASMVWPVAAGLVIGSAYENGREHTAMIN